MAPKGPAFDSLVETAKGRLSEVSEGVRLNISDMNLLHLAARRALELCPSSELPRLITELIARQDPVVSQELAKLLVSLYEVDSAATRDHYFKDRTSHLGIRYRFEWGADIEADWANREIIDSPREYVQCLVAEAVARYLIEVGGWERPAHLAPSRCGVPRSQPASASS